MPKPTPEGQPQKWRFTLDFVRLNSATGGLEGWPIPNIQQIINRIGTLKPKVFGIIDFTTGYHQTPLHPDSQEYTAFITQYELFEWNRVAMGLKGSGPFFQRSMANKVLTGYVTRICEIYIDDVLLFGTTDNEFLSNTRKVLGRLREKKVTWTDEAIVAFHYCRVAVSNCQELYFLEDTVTPILQTDASDYGIGGYLYMIVNH